MRWKAYLQGHATDLDALAQVFGTSETLAVVSDGVGTFVEADVLDIAGDDIGSVHEAAHNLLTNLNGVARVVDPSTRLVSLTGRYEDALNGGVVHVVIADSVELRSRADIIATLAVTGESSTSQPQPPPPGPSLLGLAADANVGDALRILGSGALGWVELYKLLEIVMDDLGGGKNGLVDRGWANRRELDTFTESANRSEISGQDARHARLGGSPSGRATTLPEGRELILRLVRHWLTRKRDEGAIHP